MSQDKHEAAARELFDSLATERDEWTRTRRIGRIADALRAAAAEARAEAFSEAACLVPASLPDVRAAIRARVGAKGDAK